MPFGQYILCPRQTQEVNAFGNGGQVQRRGCLEPRRNGTMLRHSW